MQPESTTSASPAAKPRAHGDAWSVMRSLAFALFQMLVTPPYALIVLALFWLPPVPRYRFITGWCALNLTAARILCGIRHRVVGLENVGRTPLIVACKHSSTWETLFLSRLLPPLAYVAKKELLSLPFFGWAFRLASPITIDRKAGQDAMSQIAKQGRERFAQGFWIMLYPEGTRIAPGRRVRYKTGAARLAIDMRTPILPIAHNAGWLWPKGILGKQAGTITLSIGEPIPPDGKDAGRLMQAVESWIENEVARIGDPRAAHATKAR
ncbi:MAG TPA: lysophospholipid acyltransferase family protein [Casimicrobiaceae bacterium]|jgi:1-acyl-sn-glycerol-3-phosphate acyltransferase|nr:lysophospholipid acyltransferase family protein [Casimicrobiaceae bacterium]